MGPCVQDRVGEMQSAGMTQLLERAPEQMGSCETNRAVGFVYPLCFEAHKVEMASTRLEQSQGWRWLQGLQCVIGT